MAAQWPLIVAKLLTLLPTLDGWTAVKVIDGPPVDDNVTGLYCTVGYATDRAGAGNFQTVLSENGVMYTETGDVQCELVCQRQRNDLAQARADVFAVFDALDTFIRADKSLEGTMPTGSTLAVVTDTVPAQTASGPFMSLPFTISYLTIN